MVACWAQRNCRLKPSFYIATFGCKANQYDTQAVRESLVAAGCEEKPLGEGPDFVVVNTCAVTRAAEGKARRFVRWVARELPRSRIVVTGCMVSRDAGQFAGVPGVWEVLDNEHKADLAHVLSGAVAGGSLGPAAPADASGRHPWPDGGISDFAGHTRAFVKVQEGCDAGCAYCIVPAVRGGPRSRPMAEAVEEIRRLSVRFREIVLTGIHVGLYRDGSGAGLAELVRAVLQSTPVERLRLSSIEVNEITPALLDLAAESPRLCPHFHVPLQSGSDRVLRQMKRRYTSAEFLGALGRIRCRLDRPSFTTDVIVGFPGETDADFGETIAVSQAAGFNRMHIFPYSGRPGTPAAAMSGKCPAAVITRREEALKEVASGLALAYKEQFVGETVEVLAETARGRSGKLCGYTGRYVRVLFDGPDDLRGRMVPVMISHAAPQVLFGRPAGDE